MEFSRRQLFEELLASGALAALLASDASGQTKATLSPGEMRPNDFWGAFYDSVDPSKGKGIRKNTQKPAQGKQVSFLYYESGSGLRYADQLKKTDLLDHTGDVTVDLTLGQFRPGRADGKTVRDYASSQLRIDCVQTKAFLNILAPSAWVALASLFTDSAGKLPSLQQLGFQQPNLMSGQNKVILPGGSGKFSVNVSSMTKESKLHAILREGVKIGTMVSPLFGFPAISIPAAQAFTAIYSLLEEKASFIMSSPLMDAAATQAALSDGSFPQTYVPLKTGEYVVVPEAHTSMMASKLSQLQLNQGYVVDGTLPGNRPVDQIANDSIPDVTYVSLKLKVTPMNVTASPVPDSSPAPAASSAASKSSKASPSSGASKSKKSD
jgi:hypothetical protein